MIFTKRAIDTTKAIFGCLLLFGSARLQAQDSVEAHGSLKKSGLDFVDHLISNKESDDAVLVLKKKQQENGWEKEQQDSINYYTGWAYYNLKQLDSSLIYFERISETSPFYLKSAFFGSFEQTYLGRYKKAETQLNSLEDLDPSLQELRLFQLSTNALANRNFKTFDSLSSKFTYSNYSCVTEQKALFKHKTELLKNKRKSPWVAGFMSAVLPGSGKYYAGYRGQAISAMIPTLIFGAAGVESYFRSGPKSTPFILAASLFSLFYVGNIWGSSLSVSTFFHQRNREIHHNLMLDLHIPLRRVFGN